MASTSKDATPKDITTADLAAQMEVLKGDIAQLTEVLGGYTKSKGAEAASAARDALHDVRVAGEAQVERARAQAEHLHAQANDFVVRQPATALGIAAGVGFLVGLMTARK